MSDTIRVTDHARFLKCERDGETIYFPDTATFRDRAQVHDEHGDPVAQMGFAVYDTNISTVYAVALYGSKGEALAHMASDTPEPATDVFDDGHASDCATHNAPATEPGECDCGAEATEDPGYAEDHPAEAHRAPKHNPRKKSTGLRRPKRGD